MWRNIIPRLFVKLYSGYVMRRINLAIEALVYYINDILHIRSNIIT